MAKHLSKFMTIAIVFVMVLTAVGSAIAQDDDKVVITISTWAGVDESAELQEIIDEINANNDDFEIVHEPIPSDYYTQVQTRLAGGTGADLYWMDQDHMGWATDGVFMDLTDMLAADDRATADIEDYFPGVIQTVTAGGEGIYGLPWIAQPVVLYYNKDLFDAAEIDYPDDTWDWDKFLEVAKELTIDEDEDGTPDQYGFIMNGWPPIQMFIWSFGGEIISDDLSESPIDTPEAIAGAQFYADMIYNEECCPSEATISEQGNAEMFKAGKVAMFMGGAADDLDRVEGLDVGISMVPMGPSGEHVTFAWIAATVINSATEHPDLAYEALIQLTEGIHHWKIVSPRVSMANVDDLIASEPRKEANAEDIIAAVPYMRGLYIIPRHSEWNTIFWEDFQDLLFHGEGTAEELAAEVRPLLEEVLPGAEE